jgi:hypothetical protein
VGINSARVATTATVNVTQGAAACVFCVMSPSATAALAVTANGSLSVSGGNLQVNSNSATALNVGANASLTTFSGKTYVVGGDTGSNLANISPAPLTGASIAADPLTSLSLPSVTAAGTGGTTLNPGIFSTLTISGNNTVNMNPGTYVFTGPITVAGNGTLTGHGVTIYLACSSYPTPCLTNQAGASLTVTGNGNVDLSGPSYGTYQGLTIFSDRKNMSTIKIGGNGDTRFVGTVYALAGTVSLYGNGRSSNVNARLVVGQVAITGNGTVDINYTQSANYVVPNVLTLTN